MTDHAASADAPLTPERMLALLEDQQRQVTARTAAFVPWILTAWGIAWVIGFIVLWADALGHPNDAMPAPAAGLTFAALLAAAGIVSTVLGARSGRGLRGTRQAAFTGIVYGNTWWLGSIAVFVIGQALRSGGMPEELLPVFYPSAFILFAGLMYLMGGLIWNAVPMLVLGVWSVVLSAVGALIPHPTAYLVYGCAGGGAFLVVAGWSAWWLRRSRRRLTGTGGERG
ncbi:hypothetical protein WDU99_08965 [Microbacterium sp. Mu-80]|uniref:Uncharacterized protein n=1 Tax=Microbacterium bandirmense TaxID=3122050 RepID=A0ABU8LAT3_9MICO